MGTLKLILAEDDFARDEKEKLLNKEQSISLITADPDIIESRENVDMLARVYGNTAVETGDTKNTRNSKTGRPMQELRVV